MHDDLAYTIRRSPRARRIRVSVDPHAGVEVILPQRATKKQAQEAVVELRPWIDRKLSEVQTARSRLASPPGTVPYLGSHLRLQYDAKRTRASGARRLRPVRTSWSSTLTDCGVTASITGFDRVRT